jgi:hypothetical protein
MQRRRISDALTALFTGEGVDHEMGGADSPLLHGSSGLDGEEFLHQGVIDTAAKPGQRLRQDKMGLCAVGLDRSKATSVHDRKIGAQAMANLFIRSAQFVFEQFQSE